MPRPFPSPNLQKKTRAKARNEGLPHIFLFFALKTFALKPANQSADGRPQTWRSLNNIFYSATKLGRHPMFNRTGSNVLKYT